jgi:hypothetical protein
MTSVSALDGVDACYIFLVREYHFNHVTRTDACNSERELILLLVFPGFVGVI